MGWLEDMTGKTATGLYVVAGLEILGAVLILFFMPHCSVVTTETAPVLVQREMESGRSLLGSI
jgi:hypothetical protein